MPASTSKKRKNASASDTRWRITSLVFVFLLVLGSLYLAFPPQEKINQGLDIQGGLSVVMSAQTTDGSTPTTEQMELSKSIIEERVNALGASETVVQIQGDDQILVQIPGMSDSQQALATIGKTGVLEFARLDSFTDEEVRDTIDSGGYMTVSSNTKDAYVSEGGTTYDLGTTEYEHMSVEAGTYTPMFTGDHIKNVSISRESDVSANYAVDVELDDVGAAAFAQASKDLVGDHGKIVIILDGQVNSAPAVQSEILDGRVQITGDYDLDGAKALQTVLNSGSLPVSFTYEQATTVGPTLGQGELQAGVLAMLLGLALVMIYLLFFYKGYGLLTAANMIVFAIIYLGILAGLSALGAFSLSLAGIAGVILAIGMAADSSILVIERFKEEIKEGRSVKAASISGVRHAIITSVDADVVSLISAVALFLFATSTIKGFGLTLGIGILCDLFVMIFFKAPLVRLLAPKVMRDHPAFWGLKYSLQLGDVRTGGNNYIPPEAVKAANAERKEKLIAAKKAEKEAKAAEKQHEKEVKERMAEREREMKEREKARKEREKARQAEAEAAEKEAEKVVDEVIDEVAEEAEAVETEAVEQVVEETSEAVTETDAAEEVVEETAEEVAEEPADELVEEATEAVEETAAEAAEEAAPESETEPEPEPEPEPAEEEPEPAEAEPEPEPEVEVDPAEAHPDVREHTAAEIAEIISHTDKFVPAPKKETVKPEDGLSYAGPGDEGQPSHTATAGGEAGPKMNRAQRRAAAKAQRKGKNKRKK